MSRPAALQNAELRSHHDEAFLPSVIKPAVVQLQTACRSQHAVAAPQINRTGQQSVKRHRRWKIVAKRNPFAANYAKPNLEKKIMMAKATHAHTVMGIARSIKFAAIAFTT